jgi:hypothetical protein
MWWFPTLSMLMLGLALFVASALQVLSFSPLATGRQEPDRDDAIGEAMAWQPAPAPRGNYRAAPTIQLRTGPQPDAAQFDVPVPPDARVPGPRMRGGEGVPPSSDRALLLTSGAMSEVLAFYRDELAIRDWYEVRSWMARPPNGVLGPEGAISAFCQGIDGPVLLVGVASGEAGLSELRLLLDAEQPGPCASSSSPGPWDGHPAPIF